MFIKWVRVFDDEGNKIKYTDEYVGFEQKNSEGYWQGGCYLYAYDPSHTIAESSPNHLDERVLYIGVAGSSTARGLVSRTRDSAGTVLVGYKQKNPYANGILFRGKYGEENRKHIYAAYMPMGFGEEVKIPAHNQETALIKEYCENYGRLPPCDGDICHVLNVSEIVKVMTPKQKENVLKKIQEIT